MTIVFGRTPLDSHCPSHRKIQDDRLDQAFRRIFERHADLLCPHHFLLHAFFVLPGFVKMVGRGILLPLII
jgi:hypothetical protein